MLEFIVDDNTVKRKNNSMPELYKVPMYSQNAIEVKFEFDDAWAGYTYTAQLTKDVSTYNLLLDASNKIFIPSDITEGIWYVSVFGVKGTATRNTTISATINVVRGGYVTTGTPPVPPSPDLYATLITETKTSETNAKTSETNAKASETAAAKSLADTIIAGNAQVERVKDYGDSRYANALIGNKSGTLVNVDDAWGVKALKAGVDGKSAQVVTVGKNLAKDSDFRQMSSLGSNWAVASYNYSFSSNGVLLTGGTDGSINQIIGDLSTFVGKSVVLSAIIDGVSYNTTPYTITGLENSEVAIKSTKNGLLMLLTLTGGKLQITFTGMLTGNVTISVVQFEVSPAATPYEPYTGGKPSPSPDYPQEIDVVDSPVVMRSYGKDFVIKHTAGKMNFSVTNATGLKWTFPDGTTSTATNPGVTLPAGETIVTCDDWMKSDIIVSDNDTNSKFVGDIKDLPPLTNYLVLDGCSAMTGNLADLPPLKNSLYISDCNLLTGNLKDLPPLEKALYAPNCTLLEGNLKDLPPITTTLSLYGCVKVEGDLSDLPRIAYSLSLGGCYKVNGVLNSSPSLKTINLRGTAMTPSDTDQTLIRLAAVTTVASGGTLSIKANRTSVSDAAFAHLSTRFTITEA